MEIHSIELPPDHPFRTTYLAGTRIDVATVLVALASGQGIDDLAEELVVDRDQILAAMRYVMVFAEIMPLEGVEE